MKRIITLLFFITIFSCSKSSDTESDTETVFTLVGEVPFEFFEYDLITISGENIDPSVTYSVTINNVEAPVVAISQTELKVQVAEGTQDGSLKIVGPQVNQTLGAITILNTEEANFYAVTRDENSNSIVQIDINTGEILEVLKTFNFDEFRIREMKYASSIHNLIVVGGSSMYSPAMGKLDLNTNTFSIHNSDILEHFEIGDNGRMFAISSLIFQVREFSIIDGSSIGEPLYTVQSPDSDGLIRIHYVEAQNKLIFYEIINYYDNGSSTPQTQEQQIDLIDNSFSTVNYDTSFEDVNISNSIMYSARDNVIGERIIGGDLQNPTETPFVSLAHSKMDFSQSSERIFFIARKQFALGEPFYLVRFHINSKSINSVTIADNIFGLVVVN